MKQKAYIKPTKPALVMGIIVTVCFFIFGIFFFYLISGESDSIIGQGFLIFWMFIVALMCGYFIYSFVNYDKKDMAGIGEEIVISDALNTRNVESTFDEKIRKLENLKKDGLISEQEFDMRRKEILNDKW